MCDNINFLELLKNGLDIWELIILKVKFIYVYGKILTDWKRSILVPVYKDKVDWSTGMWFMLSE